jgi:hypothetical protein
MYRRLTLIGTALCCVTLLSGCIAVRPTADGGTKMSIVWPGQSAPSDGTQTVNVVTTNTKPKAKGAWQGGLAMVGASLSDGNWKTQVDSVEHLNSLPDDSKPAAGKEFFVINVGIQNKGTSAALIVRPEQFELTDIKGNPIPAYKTAMSAFNAQQVKPIEVGQGGFTKFVYELAPGEANLRFVVTPNEPPANGQMAWAVP